MTPGVTAWLVTAALLAVPEKLPDEPLADRFQLLACAVLPVDPLSTIFFRVSLGCTLTELVMVHAMPPLEGLAENVPPGLFPGASVPVLVTVNCVSPCVQTRFLPDTGRTWLPFFWFSVTVKLTEVFGIGLNWNTALPLESVAVDVQLEPPALAVALIVQPLAGAMVPFASSTFLVTVNEQFPSSVLLSASPKLAPVALK